MARKKKSLPLLEDVAVLDVAAEGKAIVKKDDMVIFTQYAVPGDIVDLQITRKKNRYMEGVVVKLKQPSEKRIEAPCKHYGTCGGCKWQILPYEEQLKYKQKQVVDNLERIGKIQLPEVMPILGSKKTYGYRNKLEFTFSNKRWRTWEEIALGEPITDMDAVGFHIPNAFDKVLDIEQCLLQDDINNRLRNEVRNYAKIHHLEFFDLRNQTGFLRTMMVRTTSIGELMLVMVFYKEDETSRVALLSHIAKKFPEITSLLYVINSKANDTITDQEIHIFKGKDSIFEQMEELQFKIGPKSFYQTNSEQAYELYKVVRDFAELEGDELVYDLYTGTGTIANFVAQRAQRVVGIEYVPEAIDDAVVNSSLNGIKNTIFFAGDMKELLTNEFVSEYGRPDVIITDPPRAGMHEDVINVILDTEPKRIVYVSCNPATQARDLALLDGKYRVTKVQPVDMFPHTQHVENVVRLDLR